MPTQVINFMMHFLISVQSSHVRGLFGLILGLRRFHCLPLHVAGRIGPAALKRSNVIHDVTFAGAGDPSRGRAWVRFLECPLRSATSLDLASGRAGTTDAFGAGRTGLASAGCTCRMVASGRPAGMTTFSCDARHDREHEREKKSYERSHFEFSTRIRIRHSRLNCKVNLTRAAHGFSTASIFGFLARCADAAINSPSSTASTPAQAPGYGLMLVPGPWAGSGEKNSAAPPLVARERAPDPG